MTETRTPRPVPGGEAVNAFLARMAAGWIVGYLLDRWVGTWPWATLVMGVAGLWLAFSRLLKDTVPPPPARREPPAPDSPP